MSIKNTRRWQTLLIALVLILVVVLPTMANIKYEYQFAQGYTDNLFMDNSKTEDYNTGNKLLLTYYPTNNIKIELQGYHTYYSKIYGLSNFAGSIDFTYLPLRKESPFSILLNAKLKPTVYNQEKDEFNNNSMEFTIAGNFQADSVCQLRAGFSATANIYTNDNEAGYNTVSREFLYPSDHNIYKMYLGSNSQLGRNSSLDLEFGMVAMNLTYVFNPGNNPDIPFRDYLSVYYDTMEESHLLAYYISPRFSKLLGKKTGISVTYTFRDFAFIKDVVLPGISTGFLSPWANVYGGGALILSVKSFVVPNFILSAGVGYFGKLYIPSEKNRVTDDVGIDIRYVIYQRHDRQTKTYLSIKRPIPFKSGLFMEPALQINYNENKSNDPLYEYTAFSLTFGLTIRF
ncbi:MAG: hypothetical protein ABIJ45_01985 [Candidatus Zixiibacteriota bacterium]